MPAATAVSVASGSGGIPPRGHLAMAGDTVGCHNLGGAAGLWWVEPRDTVEATVHGWPHSRVVHLNIGSQ